MLVCHLSVFCMMDKHWSSVSLDSKGTIGLISRTLSLVKGVVGVIARIYCNMGSWFRWGSTLGFCMVCGYCWCCVPLKLYSVVLIVYADFGFCAVSGVHSQAQLTFNNACRFHQGCRAFYLFNDLFLRNWAWYWNLTSNSTWFRHHYFYVRIFFVICLFF